MTSHIVAIETINPITNTLSEIITKKYEIPHFAMCPKCKTFMTYYPSARTYAHEEQKKCAYSVSVEAYVKSQIEQQ